MVSWQARQEVFGPLTGKTRSIWSAEWDKKYSDSVILGLLTGRVKAKCETGVSDSSLKKSKRTGLWYEWLTHIKQCPMASLCEELCVVQNSSALVPILFHFHSIKISLGDWSEKWHLVLIPLHCYRNVAIISCYYWLDRQARQEVFGLLSETRSTVTRKLVLPKSGPRADFNCQKWSPWTTFGCQKWSHLAKLVPAGPNLPGPGDHFWQAKVVPRTSLGC